MGRWIGYLTTIAIVLLALLTGSSRGARAAQAVLAWNASGDSSVIGYHVYIATKSGDHPTPVSAGNTTSYTVTGLSASQTYYFNVTGYSSSAEGPFTRELVCDFITAGTASNGHITPAGSTAVAGGGSQTYSIVPNPGYQTGTVTVDGRQVAKPTSSYTFCNVSCCHTIAATFVPANYVPANYTITAASQAGGTISPSGAVSVTGGADQAFTIGPAANYTISDVQVDGTSVGAVASYTFNNVAANHTITAFFAPVTYSISASRQGGGTISPSGTIGVSSGSSSLFTITPYRGFQTSDVKVDGKSVGPLSSYAFTNVTANHDIQAFFAARKCSIAASVQGSGTISPPGTKSFSAGTNVSYSMIPATLYTLDAVLIDGNAIPARELQRSASAVGSGAGTGAATYTFANVGGNHSICAVFSPAFELVADAGPDQLVKSGSTVTMDGRNSTGSGSKIVSYKWTQVAGPAVSLSNTSSPQCAFSTQNIASTAALAFNLTVTNGAGVSSSDSCLVDVSSSGGGPSVQTGPDQTVSAYTNVTLNGSSSSDSYGTIKSYTWTQTAGPTVSIINAESPAASFVAPYPGAQGATLVFQLSVRDQYGLKARGPWTVNVMGDYQPPVANAGANISAFPMSTVTLNGKGSSDPTGSPVTYRWTQISGMPVVLSDPRSPAPTFTAPALSGVRESQLVFMLTVTSTVDQLSSTAKCTVTIE